MGPDQVFLTLFTFEIFKQCDKMMVAINYAKFLVKIMKDKKWQQENIRDHSKIHKIRECFLLWMIPIIWVLRMCPATINKDVHKDKKFIVLTEMTVCVSVFILWVIYRQYSMYQAWQPGRLIEGGAHLLTSKMKCTHSHQPFNTYIKRPCSFTFWKLWWKNP